MLIHDFEIVEVCQTDIKKPVWKNWINFLLLLMSNLVVPLLFRMQKMWFQILLEIIL